MHEIRKNRNSSQFNMDFEILINLILLAAFGCKSAGKLVMKPRDTDEKVNHSTYFNCSTDHGSTANFWFHGTKYVYTGNAILEPYHERFEIDRYVWNGTYIYNLIIHSVKPGDAGQYKCAEDEGVGEQYSVQLIVLEDDPICRSNIELDEVIGQNSCNIEPDEVELKCSVTYHGNIPPQLEWKKVGENSSTPLDVSVATSRNHFVSTLKLKGGIALNNSSYVCETKQTTQGTIKCTSEVMKILYALSNNSTVNKTIDDKIHCHANTSQSCNYTWKWKQDDDFTIESSTSVLKARKPGWHRCEAECYLRNRSCNLLVMRAMIYGDTEANPMSTVFIYVVSVVAILVVVGTLTFAICWTIKRRVKSSQRRNPQSKTFHNTDTFGNSDAPTDDASREEHGLFEEGHPDEANEQFDEDRVVLGELLKEPVRAVYGLAVLCQEVFISRLRRPYIEVYDSTTFHFKRRLEVIEMTNPEHIVSCSRSSCLYAFDWEYEKLSPAILRIDPSNGKMIQFWNIYEGGGRLSIASDTNVILNINYKAKLHEYTASGKLIRKIDLSSGTGIIQSWHAVKLPTGLLVVCHGGYDDPMSRVCLLSTKSTVTIAMGRTDKVGILKAFGAEQEKSISSFMQPMYLSVDKEGSILVSDALNKKSVLLSSNLDEPRILVSEVDGLEKSWRTCFDESTCQWFVADYHRVMVCWVKDGRVQRSLHIMDNS